MKRLRVGILGCGGIARAHARVLLELQDEARLVAFCDRNLHKAQALAAEFTDGKAAVFADHHALLEHAGLDLLIVALPPYGHSDEVEQAARRGVHLLIEKPIALELPLAWRMVEAAEQAGIKTQVGFMYRFGEALERLQSLDTGPVGLVSARYFCNALHAPWWRDRARSGGQMVEQVIHLFDLLRYLLGDPVTVYAKAANLFHRDTPGYTAEDVSATVAAFEGGALGVVYATNGAIPGRWIKDFRLVAQKLTADFTDPNRATFHFTTGPEQPPLEVGSARDLFLAQMHDLIRAIRDDRPARTPIREGAKSLEFALAARQSAETGQEVRLR
ncbi:Gfo/Idh/MocA family protein [Calidithermus chliarophilus]|uniref:Gfo/Idh/MocA family protein n=1 Tax=Calidithermus chliarophilus TaxID=52023 RepID=UPI0003FD3AF8|nr:Gfo/Idh/MocA family oxidoreductase [Calidithermus chliarophilus]